MSLQINILNDPYRKLSRAEKRNILKRVPDCFKREVQPDNAHELIREKYVDQQLEAFLKSYADTHISKLDLIRRITIWEFIKEKSKQFWENLLKKDL